MTIIVDRFEGDYAVLEVRTENGEILYKNLPLDWLPTEVCEGDVLRKTGGQYVIDAAATDHLRAENADRLSKLKLS